MIVSFYLGCAKNTQTDGAGQEAHGSGETG